MYYDDDVYGVYCNEECYAEEMAEKHNVYKCPECDEYYFEKQSDGNYICHSCDYEKYNTYLLGVIGERGCCKLNEVIAELESRFMRMHLEKGDLPTFVDLFRQMNSLPTSTGK